MMNYGKEQGENRKNAMADLIWMQYFNRRVFEDGLITEREHSRLRTEIDSRYGRMLTPPDIQNLYGSHSENPVVK